MVERSMESDQDGRARLTRIGVGDSRKRSKRNMASLVAMLESDDLFGDVAILRVSKNSQLSKKLNVFQ